MFSLRCPAVRLSVHTLTIRGQPAQSVLRLHTLHPTVTHTVGSTAAVVMLFKSKAMNTQQLPVRGLRLPLHRLVQSITTGRLKLCENRKKYNFVMSVKYFIHYSNTVFYFVLCLIMTYTVCPLSECKKRSVLTFPSRSGQSNFSTTRTSFARSLWL